MAIVLCAERGHRLSEAYVLCFKLVQKEPVSETDMYMLTLHKAAASQSPIGSLLELLC